MLQINLMKQKTNKFISNLFLLIIILTVNILFIQVDIASALEAKDSKLIEQISKDFTKKFCNSIGFGLSKESAMKFSFSENKKIFKKRKGIKDISNKLLAHEIAYSVIDGCGYQLDLYGDNDIEEFSNYYLSIEKEYS